MFMPRCPMATGEEGTGAGNMQDGNSRIGPGPYFKGPLLSSSCSSAREDRKTTSIHTVPPCQAVAGKDIWVFQLPPVTQLT